MKHSKWRLVLILALIVSSAAFYVLHYAIFRDSHHIFIYLMGDIAFVPIEVLMVTLIIHKLLEQREKTLRMEKLNMVIGAFFSEIGRDLLVMFSDADPDLDEIKNDLIIDDGWNDSRFEKIAGKLRKRRFSVDLSLIDLPSMKKGLVAKKPFLVSILENPNVLEHERFTDLLWAVFHLLEELEFRHEVDEITGQDREHIRGDIDRTYGLLVIEWLSYMKHLKNSYPYLFSLAIRVNPFNENASPVVG